MLWFAWQLVFEQRLQLIGNEYVAHIINEVLMKYFIWTVPAFLLILLFDK